MNWTIAAAVYSVVATLFLVRVLFVSVHFDDLAQWHSKRDECEYEPWWKMIAKFWIWDIEQFRK